MPTVAELREIAEELLLHFETEAAAATSSVTTLTNRSKSRSRAPTLSTLQVCPGEASPSTANSMYATGIPPVFPRCMQEESHELEELGHAGGAETDNLEEFSENVETDSFSGLSMSDADLSPENKAEEENGPRTLRPRQVNPDVRRSARLMKQKARKPNAKVQANGETVKRKRGRPRRSESEQEKPALKNEGKDGESDVPTKVKKKVAEADKPLTEEEQEELMWKRLARLERLQEKNASKKKDKPTAVKKAPQQGGEGSDSEAHFVLPVNLEELEPDQEASEDEQNDLRDIWRDADFAIRNSVDNIMEQAKKITALQKYDCDCDHEFAFKEDIGKVCIDCGYVDKLVTQHFELRSYKRARTINSNRLRLEDDHASRKVESREETFDEVEEFNPNEFHLKRMHEHQKEGFRFLVQNLFGKDTGGVFLHHAPGTGKTFLVVSFLQTYFYKFPDRRALIAAPKNMLEPWEREFKKWQVDPVSVKVLFGDDKLTTVSEWYDGTGVLLVTPNMLALLLDERKSDPSFQEIRQMLIEGPHLLVVDEAHVARNRSANIFSSLRNIKTRQRIFLSGTAFQNNLDEVFDLLKLCRPNFIDWSPEYGLAPDKSQKQFFKETVQNRLVSDRAGAVRSFRSLTEPFVQWYGGKVLEKLPGLQDFIVTLKLSDDHFMKVKQCVSYGGYGKSSFMAEDHKLAQACVHPCLVNDMLYMVNQDPYAGLKTAFIMELLRFVGKTERVIIFCQFKKPLALLKQMLKDEFRWSEGREILHIDGETARGERMVITDDFNSGKSKARVLLASLKTCGEGISLVGGSRVVVLDIAWNPSVVRQAVSRAFRIGQTKKVFVYRLLATDTEEVDKLRSCLEKEFLGRALFDTSFNIDSDSMPMDLTDVTEFRDDKFLAMFVRKYKERCVVRYMK